MDRQPGHAGRFVGVFNVETKYRRLGLSVSGRLMNPDRGIVDQSSAFNHVPLDEAALLVPSNQLNVSRWAVWDTDNAGISGGMSFGFKLPFYRGVFAQCVPCRNRLPFCGTNDVERVMGIEPTYAAWKAAVLPLNYTRIPANHTGHACLVNPPSLNSKR